MLRRLFALVILVALAAGAYYYWKLDSGASAPELGEVGRRLDDAKLRARVKAAFELDRTLQPLPVRVEAEAGVVTLRGQVPSDEAARLAAEVAGQVPGVAQVVSHLRVVADSAPADAPGARSVGESLDDHALELKVRLALSLKRELADSDIQARAYRRALTLTGRVRSARQREVALAVAREVPGVASVADRLQLEAGGPTPAADREPDVAQARAAVERALRANPHLAGYDVRVELRDGRLRLVGTVASGAEQELAGLVARDAARRPVDNGLRVEPR